MDALPTAFDTSMIDPSLLSAGANGAMNPWATIQAVSAMLGINLRLVIIVALWITVFFCIVFWKVFAKAGHKGYEALVSGHNGYVFITMAGKPGRYYFLFIIPILIMNAPVVLGMINATALQISSILGTLLFLALYVDLTLSLMKKFKKGIWFGIGAILLPIIFYPILAFGDSKYSK